MILRIFMYKILYVFLRTHCIFALIDANTIFIFIGNYHHTLNNIQCLETPIKWLKIDDPAGLSIVIISCIGLLASMATCIFMYRFWELVTVHEKSKHLLTFVCVLLFFTFGYGPLHIIEPTFMFCSVRNGYFFVLLMIYTSFVLTKTQAMCSNIQYYCDKFFRGNMTATQGKNA